MLYFVYYVDIRIIPAIYKLPSQMWLGGKTWFPLKQKRIQMKTLFALAIIL